MESSTTTPGKRKLQTNQIYICNLNLFVHKLNCTMFRVKSQVSSQCFKPLCKEKSSLVFILVNNFEHVEDLFLSFAVGGGIVCSKTCLSLDKAKKQRFALTSLPWQQLLMIAFISKTFRFLRGYTHEISTKKQSTEVQIFEYIILTYKFQAGQTFPHCQDWPLHGHFFHRSHTFSRVTSLNPGVLHYWVAHPDPADSLPSTPRSLLSHSFISFQKERMV